MTSETRSLLAAVLALPEAERVPLMNDLPDTLPPQPAELADDPRQAALERSFEDYQRVPSAAIPWAEVKRPR